MSQTASVWLVVVLAAMAANLPFVNQRLLGLWALKSLGPRKSLALRLLELVLCYLVVGGVGLALEQRAGQMAPQGWEFYAITAALFLTLAFPGFVHQYLLRRRA